MGWMDGWESRQIEYVIGFYKTPIDSDAYLDLPAGFYVDKED